MYSNHHYKPMLTQQQKNNRRKRASPDQLAYLRKSFMIDPKPDQSTREEIGRRIDMTPRSVQIWFQNNRAKNKLQEKRLKSVCRLPSKTSRCNDNISRIHVDLSAVDGYTHSDMNNFFYQNPGAAGSAPIVSNSGAYFGDDFPNCRSSSKHHRFHQLYSPPDMCYSDYDFDSRDLYRSSNGCHAPHRVESVDSALYASDRGCFHASTPDVRQFRMCSEPAFSPSVRGISENFSSSTLDEMLESPSVATESAYAGNNDEVSPFYDPFADDDLNLDLNELMGAETADAEVADSYDGIFPDINDIPTDNGISNKPEFSVFLDC